MERIQANVNCPILATDSTVRIWNYQTAKVELVKKYPYEITSIALHSTGLFVALGFSDRLHLMEILLDTLKVKQAFFSSISRL